MEATIRLTRFVSDDEALPTAQRQAWPVSVLAQGVNIDDHIFVYHVGKADDPIQGDRFEAVASVNQMYEIPKNQGVSLTTQTGIPFYRSNVVDYVARSAVEADEIWNKIVEEVEWLVKNWNSALKLKATTVATITESLTTRSDAGMKPPIRIALSYHPAGTPGTDVNSKPIIVSPDTQQVGWLPVSVLGVGAVVPPGAKFYYNIDVDGGLAQEWPPVEPFSGNQLFRNGISMPYGIVWSLTNRTVWWRDFNPADIPGYLRLGANEDWGAPWPADYVNRSNPGAVPNHIALMLFK